MKLDSTFLTIGVLLFIAVALVGEEPKDTLKPETERNLNRLQRGSASVTVTRPGFTFSATCDSLRRGVQVRGQQVETAKSAGRSLVVWDAVIDNQWPYSDPSGASPPVLPVKFDLVVKLMWKDASGNLSLAPAETKELNLIS